MLDKAVDGINEKGKKDMKRIYMKMLAAAVYMFLFVFCVTFFAVDVQAEAKQEYMTDVALDEVHFPDQQFREKLKLYVDVNKDDILSREEREKIYYLDLHSYTNGITNSWFYDMKYMVSGYYSEDYIISYKIRSALLLNFNYDDRLGKVVADKPVDLKGIEYFFNLQEVKIEKYELVSGSFRNNSNLRKILIGCSNAGEISYDLIQRDFPVSQLTYVHLKNVAVNTLNVKEMPNLQVLRLSVAGESSYRLSVLDFSQNLKLREIELGNIVPAKLDLTKNEKVNVVKVYSGECRAGSQYGLNPQTKIWYQYFLPQKSMKCKITFAKKNNIQTLYYFTADKTIDISRLSKLEDFQTLKSVKAKVKSSWIRKTFKKKKWGCAVVKSGKFINKIKAGKKKKYTMI